MADKGAQRDLRNVYGWRRFGAFGSPFCCSWGLAPASCSFWDHRSLPRIRWVHLLMRRRWQPDPHRALQAMGRSSCPVLAGRDTPGPIADPDPALLEPLSKGSQQNLPRHRHPMAGSRCRSMPPNSTIVRAAH